MGIFIVYSLNDGRRFIKSECPDQGLDFLGEFPPYPECGIVSFSYIASVPREDGDEDELPCSLPFKLSCDPRACVNRLPFIFIAGVTDATSLRGRPRDFGVLVPLVLGSLLASTLFIELGVLRRLVLDPPFVDAPVFTFFAGFGVLVLLVLPSPFFTPAGRPRFFGVLDPLRLTSPIEPAGITLFESFGFANCMATCSPVGTPTG